LAVAETTHVAEISVGESARSAVEGVTVAEATAKNDCRLVCGARGAGTPPFCFTR
jgi:hypothetical protein